MNPKKQGKSVETGELSGPHSEEEKQLPSLFKSRP